MELAMFQAWNTARLSHYTGGKLKPLGAYMKELRRSDRPVRKQSPTEIVAALRAIRATMGG